MSSAGCARHEAPPLPPGLAYMQKSRKYPDTGHPSAGKKAASGSQRVIFPAPIGSQTSGKGRIHAA